MGSTTIKVEVSKNLFDTQNRNLYDYVSDLCSVY